MSQQFTATALKYKVQTVVARSVSAFVKGIGIGAGGLGFPPRAGQTGQCRQRLTTAATFFCSCVTKAHSCGDGLRHSLHASPQYPQHHKDLIFLLQHKIVEPILTCNKQSNPSDDAMHGNCRVEWDVSMEYSFSKSGYHVSGHSNQEAGVSKHHTGCSSTSYGHTISRNSTQSSPFTLNGKD